MAAYDPSGLPDMTGEQSGEYSYDHNAQDAGDDDDDYDPSSFNFGDQGNSAQQDMAMTEAGQQPAHTETAAAEQTSKPKTVGGFIVDESDGEEEQEGVPPPSQLSGTEGTQSGLGAAAISDAAQQMAGTQDVSTLASEPTQDSAAAQNAQASLNGSTAATPTPVPTSTSVDPSSASAFTTPAAQVQAQQGKAENISPAAAGTHGTVSVSATPKPSVNGVTAPPEKPAVSQTPTSARLPHDRVGRLEDRIAEDPKADTAAWLELAQHYREKDQIDNVRKTYDRMLEWFPTAVRTIPTSATADQFACCRMPFTIIVALAHMPS